MGSKEERCQVCGWPLAERWEDGCVPGNCSMRPRPSPTYEERSRTFGTNGVASYQDLLDLVARVTAERDALRETLSQLRLTIIRMRDSGHELPASLFRESEKWEQDATEQALASGLGVSEWPAFLS